MDVSSFFSGLGGVIIGGGVLWLVLKAKFDRLATLEERVEKAVDAELDKLGRRIGQIEKEVRGMNTAVLENRQQATNDLLLKMDKKLDVINDTVVTQGVRLGNLEGYVASVHRRAKQNAERLHDLDKALAVSDATQRLKVMK